MLRRHAFRGSTLRIAMPAPPRGGALTCSLTEPAAEMSLVGEPAILCDLCQREVADQHEMSRVLQSPSDQVGLRWLAEGVFEAAREMVDAEIDDFAERFDPDGFVQILFDDR